MAMQNAFEDCKIVLSMSRSIKDGESFQEWTFTNRGLCGITMSKAASLWEKAKEATQSEENWSTYILKMVERFTKAFVCEMNLLESNGGDAKAITEQIMTTLSECWG